MSHILVTGGAGYVGSHTCKALAKHGFIPVTYDNLSTGYSHLVKWGPLVEGDILDEVKVEATIKKYDIAAVLHFAGLSYVGESVRHPDLYYQNNLIGSLALFHAMRKAGVDRVVFSSSCAVYGTPEKLPITENNPRNPLSPYGKTKWMIEEVLSDLNTAFGFKSVALRYFNAAGADPDGETGELHQPETHLIPLAIDTAYGVIDTLSVFGDDYQTADGTCIRDYVHVTDLAEAHVLALQRLMKSQALDPAYNLGIGHGYTVRQVIASVERITKKKINTRVQERRHGDAPILYAENSRAKQDLSWRPQYTDLDEIIASAVKFFDGRKR